MSHFAQIENGIVTRVIVAEQDFIDSGAVGDPATWRQTSIRTSGNTHPEGRPLRGNFASAGYIYDAANDVFYPPKPFASWSLDTATWTWQPPQPYPQGTISHWNEELQQWTQNE